MLRKEVVLESLNNYTKTINLEMIRDGYNGVTTQELVDKLDIDRTNCSRELNNLVNDGLVIKITGKPVRYFPVEHLESLIFAKIIIGEGTSLREIVENSVQKLSDFDSIIGAGGSLSMAIDQAKAAMIYPPFGLHTLITGETGIGKTMFVELMYNYAKEFGVLDNRAELVTFNCAEYADNPQLLVSELFGYTKGSFTGADTNKPGLIDRANKGILFLDEIHRLPSEGQEMLFQLMDSGKYRKMGDSTQEWRANVLIVGATTESIESNLLLTFIRRIPMLITLPSLEQRPLKEHLDLINLFFEMEQSKIKKNIHVDRKVLESLLRYRYPGNIGQLKTDIQLICARAFLDSMKNKNTDLKVTQEFLPQYLLENSYGGNDQYIAVDTLLKSYDKGAHYDGNQIVRTPLAEVNTYNGIDETMGIDEIKHYIQNMILGSYENRGELKHNPDEIFKIIKPEIYYSVAESLSLAQSRLKCTFSSQTYIAFGLHIQSIIERGLEAKVFYNVSEDIKVHHPEEYQAAKLVMSYLADELKYDFAPEEAYLATLFLTTHHEKDEERVGLMVIAHGNGVAKNIVNVANTLLETDHAEYLDMGLDENVDTFYDKFKAKAKLVNEGKGVLIIADMGSLMNFGERFTKETGIPTKTVNFVSTPLVLESLRKVLFSTTSLGQIHYELLMTLNAMSSEPEVTRRKRLDDTQHGKPKAIVVTCMTGEGAAIALKNYIQDSLSSIGHLNLNIVTTNKQNYDPSLEVEYEVTAVIGAVDLKLDSIPYISTEEVLLGNGLKTLEFLLLKRNSQREYLTNQRIDTILRILEDTLGFLNPEKTLNLVMDTFMQISDNYEIPEFERLNINYSLHLPNMIERVIRNEKIPYDEIESRIKQNQKLYDVIKEALKTIEEAYRIQIPDTEIGYIMDMFATV